MEHIFKLKACAQPAFLQIYQTIKKLIFITVNHSLHYTEHHPENIKMLCGTFLNPPVSSFI
jgi:hypothetical protein